MAENDRYRVGGLMPCCIESLLEAPEGKEGDKIPCKHHANDGDMMVYFKGAWQWVGPGRNGGAPGTPSAIRPSGG